MPVPATAPECPPAHPRAAAASTPDRAVEAPAASRRRFIRLVGGGTVVAALPLAGCASGLPSEATAAWRSAAGETDLRRFMLAHALLAPNPHNRQPWIADLSRPGQITLLCDGERMLPETDPYGRQILIGCGAFIELAVVAANERGVRVDVERFPAGEPPADALPGRTPVATLRLGPAGSAAPDPLFAQIPRRHTAKSAYADGRVLPGTLLASWDEVARRSGLQSGVVTDPAAMEPIRRITREAYEIECTTPRTWLESAHLIRIGPGAIASHRDGISINEAMPRLMHTIGLFDPLEVPRRGSSNFERVMQRWPAFETASGYLWLTTDGNDRASQIEAGRAYVRMHLQATAAGVDLHPLSQALQEFPEVRGPYLALHRALGVDPQRRTVQMLARTGYALRAAGPSPRRGLQALVGA